MNFSEMLQTWLRVTTSPSEATFDAERQKPNATLVTALIWIVIYAAIATLLGWLSSVMFAGAMQSALPSLLAQADLPPETKAQLQPLLTSGLFAGLGAANFTSIIIIPIMFLISVGVYHLIAKLLGGVGEYGRFAYLNAAFAAPLGILASIISLLPLVGCVSIFISLYEIYLTYVAVRTEHRLSSGKAWVTVLLPLIVVLLLISCLVFGLLGLAISLQSNR